MSTIYFDKITQEIGFDPKVDCGYFDPLPDENNSKIVKPLLETDKDGNVIWNLMDMNGNIRKLDTKEDVKSKIRIRPIQIIRYANPENDNQKYKGARVGQGVWPWISKEIVELYKNKTKVRRLILTEGYKKAFVACKKGIPCIGLPGITVWRQKEDETKEIFNDIKLFINACQVEEVLWLQDADAMTIRWAQDKDLYKRPFSFFTSVKLFRNFVRDKCATLYYAHIVTESKHKGIDDLLLNNLDKVSKITKELTSSTGNTTFISRYDITNMQNTTLQQLFGIGGDVQQFYDKYESFIGVEEFVYRNGTYQYDVDSGEVKYLQCAESNQFVRVMDDYFMKAIVPVSGANGKRTLLPTKVGSIKVMFKKLKEEQINRIIYDVPFYHGFFNEPGHIDYRQVIPSEDENGFTTYWLNKYMKLNHRIVQEEVSIEDIPISFKFIKHIFGEDDIDYKGRMIKGWELGFDYIQLLYMQPKQMLPVLSLVSEQNQTGKTKFWDWLVEIFQQNARKIQPDVLTGTFTEYFMSSLLVVIDEALLNKRETMERVKSITTSSSAMVNGKHVKEVEIQTYLKIGLSTNNVDDFAILTKNDQRFWVREIPEISENDYVIDFFDKLRNEIPYFISFLIKRKMATDKDDDRMYFAPWVRHTKALDRVIKGSKPANENLIESAIKNYISDSQRLVVKLGKSDIRDLCDERNLPLNTVTWIVEQKMRHQPLRFTSRYKFYKIDVGDDENGDRVTEVIRKTTYYTFYATEFFSSEEILQIVDLPMLIVNEEE